ncbi:MAG: hypothetical protein II330_05630 [Clostridia bacterium]|nr:hypothetical protein [Clostridia bacterium]
MTTLNVRTRLLLCMLAAILTLSFAACQPQTSPENPDAPSDEQTTAAPETESETVGSIQESTAEPETEPVAEKKGCGSVIGGAFAVALMLGVACAVKKKD